MFIFLCYRVQSYDDFSSIRILKKRKLLTKREQNKEKIRIFANNMDTEFAHLQKQSLRAPQHAVGHGALLICHQGQATVTINFGSWHLQGDSVIIFFPGDVVHWSDVSDDFEADILRYSADVLRGASLNIEHEIYMELRKDRICHDEVAVIGVVKNMFHILAFYFKDGYTPSVQRIVSLQLQSFFIGFADYVRCNPHCHCVPTNDSQRNQQLFAQFMQLIEEHHKDIREVSAYALLMHISRKYLSRVSQEHTGLPPKKIIDEYLVEQLKLTLYNTSKSLKEVAAEYHFPDQSALTRYFRQHCGITPKHYVDQALPSSTTLPSKSLTTR